MSERNFEQIAQKVSELALEGQGCDIWDQVRGLGRDDLSSVLKLAQAKGPNPASNEAYKLPAVQFNDFNLGFVTGNSVNLLDDRRNSVSTEIFRSEKGWLGENHSCINLSKIDHKNGG